MKMNQVPIAQRTRARSNEIEARARRIASHKGAEEQQQSGKRKDASAGEDPDVAVVGVSLEVVGGPVPGVVERATEAEAQHRLLDGVGAGDTRVTRRPSRRRRRVGLGERRLVDEDVHRLREIPGADEGPDLRRVAFRDPRPHVVALRFLREHERRDRVLQALAVRAVLPDLDRDRLVAPPPWSQTEKVQSSPTCAGTGSRRGPRPPRRRTFACGRRCRRTWRSAQESERAARPEFDQPVVVPSSKPGLASSLSAPGASPRIETRDAWSA